MLDNSIIAIGVSVDIDNVRYVLSRNPSLCAPRCKRAGIPGAVFGQAWRVKWSFCVIMIMCVIILI
jgi:hypothetical protein